MVVDSLLLAVTAWVFVMILTKDGMILGWWGRALNRFPLWLGEPLGGCEYCVAGQMALWYYLYKHRNDYLVTFCDRLIEHIIFISLTIFIVEIINVWKQGE